MIGACSGAAVQAVTVGARHAPGRVVAALFDTHEDGLAGYELLADKLGWKSGRWHFDLSPAGKIAFVEWATIPALW